MDGDGWEVAQQGPKLLGTCRLAVYHGIHSMLSILCGHQMSKSKGRLLVTYAKGRLLGTP